MTGAEMTRTSEAVMANIHGKFQAEVVQIVEQRLRTVSGQVNPTWIKDSRRRWSMSSNTPQQGSSVSATVKTLTNFSWPVSCSQIRQSSESSNQLCSVQCILYQWWESSETWWTSCLTFSDWRFETKIRTCRSLRNSPVKDVRRTAASYQNKYMQTGADKVIRLAVADISAFVAHL